jgi:tetratricopeptide (TPR) repeat protein
MNISIFIGHRKFLSTSLVSVLFLSIFFLTTNIAGQSKSSSFGQYKGLPVTKDRLIRVLQGKKLPQGEIIEVIEMSGVDFETTPAIEQELGSAGARPAVLKAVKNNYRGASITGKVEATKTDEWFVKGDTLFQEEKWEQAVTAYKMSLETKPSYQAYLNIGRSYLKMNKPQLALENLQASLKLNPNFALTWSRIGSALISLNNTAEALEAGKKSVDLDPECDVCWNNLGVIYQGLKDYPEAILGYRKAIEFNPTSFYFRNLGNVLTVAGKIAEANFAYQNAIERKPDDDLTWAAWAESYRIQKNYPEAVKAAQKAVQLNPNQVFNQIVLGTVMYAMENYQFAAEAFEKAARIDAANSNVWAALGSAYFNMKRWDDAVMSLKQAIKLNSENADAWFNLGSSFYNLKNYTQAADAYRQVIRIKPDYPNARLVLSEVEKKQK